MRASISLRVAGMCCLALALAGCGQVEPVGLAKVPAPKRNRIAEESPPHPTHFDVAPAPRPEAEPEPPPEPEQIPPSEMPPASAGTNGSFTPPPPSRRKDITPRTMERLERESEGTSAILLSGIALAPPKAPEAIKATISAANEIVGRPYIWGGGHSSWYSRGYDCSGAVSYALAGGGFLAAPLASGQFESWGEPGQGRWLTVYANAGHAYAVVAGLRWDTVGDAHGTGPRWHPALAYTEGFVARHPAGF